MEERVGVHISRIEIHNFRNFAHLVLGPFPARAVIVGENGVGKSNLLHALRLVLDPALPDSSRLLRQEDIWEGIPHGLADGVVVRIEIELQGFDNDDNAKAVLSDAVIAASPYTARLTYELSPRPTVAEIQQDDRTILLNVDRPLTTQDYDFVVYGGLNPANDLRRIRRDIALRVLPALRDAETDLQSWRRNPLRDLLERLPLDPFNLEATADAVAKAVAQLTHDPNVSVLENHLATRLEAMVGPRLPVTPTLGFASSQPDELIRAVRLFVDSGRHHGVADASLGSANVIYLGLLLEALSQQRADDMFVTTILAVEEPEAHLHVTLQRRLFSYLLRSETTLLLTTHSPHIAAVTPIASLVLLRSTPAGSIGYTTTALPVGEAQAKDLERYLDVSRAEILFATAVILVEGLAESYLIPALAASAQFDLDSYGIVVASVHGTDFAPFVALLGPEGLNVPYVIVTDGDAAGDERGVVEAGLKRAARLLPDPEQRDQLLQAISELPEPQDDQYRAERDAIVNEFSQRGIYVGWQTLEVDLCPLFPDEIVNAYVDFRARRKPAREAMSKYVDNELSSTPNFEIRTEMLSRISAIGKGRFAQRLSSLIADTDLRDKVLTALGLEAEDLTDLAGLATMSPGYILQALHHVSMTARHVPIFAPVDSVEDEMEG